MGKHFKSFIAELAEIARVLELGDPDVDFRVRNRSIKVHKKVLEKSSPVLKAKLSDVWQTSGDVLQLDEEYVEPEVVFELLIWIYFNYLDVPWECSIENSYSLCIAADYLQMPELVTSCCSELCKNIIPENFFDLYLLSKHLNLDDLRHACKNFTVKMPINYLLNPQVVKLTAGDLKMFFEKLLEDKDSLQVRETILSSLIIWSEGSFEGRSRELEKLFRLIPPETLTSDALFRFMETDLYSKLDELHRKQYYVRSYLPTGVSSTDKLYCISRKVCSWFGKVYCLDLSADKWSQPAGRFGNLFDEPVLGVSWQKEIYYFTCRASVIDSSVSAKIDESLTSKLIVVPGGSNQKMLAGAALDGYIYMTLAVELPNNSFEAPDRSVNRYSLETNQWESLEDMQTARLDHSLVVLKNFLYAIGGEVLGQETTNVKNEKPEKKLSSYLSTQLHKFPGIARAEKILKTSSSNRGSRPERYDLQTNRWKYIAPSNYLHELPAAVAHEGQIYVLSQAGFEAYSPKTYRWTQLPVPDVCLRSSLVSVAGRLWLLTDSVYPKKTPGLIFEFDVVKQEWTRLPDFPEVNSSAFFSFAIKQ